MQSNITKMQICNPCELALSAGRTNGAKAYRLKVAEDGCWPTFDQTSANGAQAPPDAALRR